MSSAEVLIAILGLPLLLPLGLLLLLKGLLGLRDGRFALYRIVVEGPGARTTGAAATAAGLLLLGLCWTLLAPALGLPDPGWFESSARIPR